MTTEHEPPDDWSEFDDTVADAAQTGPIPPAARQWVADQRFLHGLLRATQQVDAQAREARIAAILAAVQRPARPRSWLVAAAALLLCVVGGALWWPDRLPEAEAAVVRAAQLLGEPIDRRFRVTTSLVGGGREQQLDFELTARPGMHVLIVGNLPFGPFRVDDVRVGCDGTEAWMKGGPDPRFWRALPLASAQQLLAGMGGVLDLGYLDVHALVDRMPATFELRTVGRERDAAGREVLRIAATGQPRLPGLKLKRAELLVEEATGMVTRIEVELDGPSGATRHLTFEYTGSVQLDVAAYRRPW